MLNTKHIVAFSDSHGQQHYVPTGYEGKYTNVEIPDCDILICAGDYSWESGIRSSIDFIKWLKEQPGTHKIVVPGNHDFQIEDVMLDETTDNIHVLINRGIELEGIRFFGSPYTLEFMNWNYMLSEYNLEKVYSYFPNNLDVLITHGPPYGILDKIGNNRIGSTATLKYVEKVKPKLHIFGHNHCNGNLQYNGTQFYNVSLLDQEYTMQNKVTEIVYEN